MENMSKNNLFVAVTPVLKNKDQRMSIRLTKEERAWIDTVAKDTGRKASDVVRDALRIYSEELGETKHV